MWAPAPSGVGQNLVIRTCASSSGSTCTPNSASTCCTWSGSARSRPAEAASTCGPSCCQCQEMCSCRSPMDVLPGSMVKVVTATANASTAASATNCGQRAVSDLLSNDWSKMMLSASPCGTGTFSASCNSASNRSDSAAAAAKSSPAARASRISGLLSAGSVISRLLNSSKFMNVSPTIRRLQLVLELLARPEHPGHHCAFGQFELGGDLGNRQSHHGLQYQRFAVFPLQFKHRLAQQIALGPVFGCLLRLLGHHHVVDVGDRRHLAFEGSRELAPQDGDQPALGRTRILQAVQRFPGAHERFLDQVVGQRVIAAQPDTKAEKVVGILPRQRIEAPFPFRIIHDRQDPLFIASFPASGEVYEDTVEV